MHVLHCLQSKTNDPPRERGKTLENLELLNYGVRPSILHSYLSYTCGARPIPAVIGQDGNRKKNKQLVSWSGM